ncbi:unnamed protein product [Ceutorhynchus assimilis]|uniref:Uncharacterized protein n=1 Tax=Ceutorhynchus assimilis TaxID=467358 RepID=A0A9N9QS07_9CUCU|nr:unnamed protein product [Ceutorhynchus assimilis]
MDCLDRKLAEFLPNYSAIWTDTLNEDLIEFQFETFLDLNDDNSKMSIMDTEENDENNEIIYILEEKSSKGCASENIESTKWSRTPLSTKSPSFCTPTTSSGNSSKSSRQIEPLINKLVQAAEKVFESDKPVAITFSNSTRLSDFAKYLAASLNMLDEELCDDDTMTEMVVIVGPCAIAFTCDMVTAETNKLLSACYELQEKFDYRSKEYQKLHSFGLYIASTGIRLTAADFFEINLSTLLPVIATSTTYFIALVQFY